MDKNDKVEANDVTKVSGRDIALEAIKRGKVNFTMDLMLAAKMLDNSIKQAESSIRQAYNKDKDTAFAASVMEHATICFSYADGKLLSALTVGTGQGIKCLCDMLPAWFQEHYEVIENGKSVKPKEE